MNPEHHHGEPDRQDPDRPKAALTQPQREELRLTLETRRAQLLRALREHEDSEEERDDPSILKDPGDAADLAEASLEDHDRISMAEHDLELLEEVDHALSRLDAGTYGLSEASGQPIPYERLRAVPWARYCADEAERLEHVSWSGGGH